MRATANPDLLKAACSVLEREWGHYGYGVDLAAGGSGAVILEVLSLRDGAGFFLWYANNGEWGHADELAAAASDLRAARGLEGVAS